PHFTPPLREATSNLRNYCWTTVQMRQRLQRTERRPFPTLRNAITPKWLNFSPRLSVEISGLKSNDLPSPSPNPAGNDSRDSVDCAAPREPQSARLRRHCANRSTH